MRLKRLSSMLLALALIVGLALPAAAQGEAADSKAALAEIPSSSNDKQRLRTIITNDGEVDDMDSFLRVLLYANEFQIEGIVLTSSQWHWAGDGLGTVFTSPTRPSNSGATFRWLGDKWMFHYLDQYEKVYPNLVQHDENYPDPDYLRSITKIGNIEFEGEMEKDTEGSELIKEILLDRSNDDEIYLQVWGGTNTVARALKSIQEEYEGTAEWDEIYEYVSGKAIIYTILDQDITYSQYVAPNWPNIRVIYNSGQFWSFAYQWTSTVPAELQPYLRADWMKKYILDGHGPLLEEYMTHGDGHNLTNIGELGSAHKFGDDDHPEWGEPSNEDRGTYVRNGYNQYDFISEGDSPAFLYMVDYGMRTLENPEWGGWNGRFEQSAQNPLRWEDSAQDYNPYTDRMDQRYPITRWVPEIQWDFASRADWCVMSYEEANHRPEAIMYTPVDVTAAPGQAVTMVGGGNDPDGDEISFHWWQYTEAGSYDGEAAITGTDSDTAVLTVPEDANEGDTIHVIFEVRDVVEDGTPPLVSYRRVVITVGETEDSIVKLSTDAHNVKKGETFKLETTFAEEQESNTAILNYTWNGDLFQFAYFYKADGVILVDHQYGDGWAKITLMAPDYDLEALGTLDLTAREDAPLVRGWESVKLDIEYVLRDENGDKSIENAATSTRFTTVGNGQNPEPYLPGDTNDDGVVDIMDLSNMIDWFGYTSENQSDWDDWYTYFDFNNDGEIDISDIAHVAKLI